MDNFAVIMPYIHLAAGFAALILSGNWLVTGGVQLARYFKISTLLIGLTVVAFATSAPELFVSIEAALKNAPDITLGNVIGSNIANIALILAVTALINPIHIPKKSVYFDLVIMLIVTVLLFFFGYNGIIRRIEGICFVAIFAAYTIFSVIKEKKKTKFEETAAATMNPLLALLLIAAAVTGLYFGSDWFITGAREIALQWGVSERVIGISIVALGTSMPELVASVIAAVRKEMDLSVGNIIGSNIFNITVALGTTSIIRPLSINSQSMFVSDMIWVFGISIVLLLVMLPFSYKVKDSPYSAGKILRWEGGILLLMFAVYIYTLYGAGK